ESTLRDIPEAARALGLQIQVLRAGTSREIEAAFATLARDRADAFFVAPDGFFTSRRVQFATLAARHAIPAAYSNRSYPEVGGLMSYGSLLWTIIVRLASTPVKSSRVRSLPRCRSCRRPNGSSSSTCRRPGRSALPCRRRCSQPPTR